MSEKAAGIRRGIESFVRGPEQTRLARKLWNDFGVNTEITPDSIATLLGATLAVQEERAVGKTLYGSNYTDMENLIATQNLETPEGRKAAWEIFRQSRNALIFGDCEKDTGVFPVSVKDTGERLRRISICNRAMEALNTPITVSV